jgi:DNA repair protein RadA/Sms
MARGRSVYRCTECGHEHAKWVGRCEGCGAWNAVAEEPTVLRAAGSPRRAVGRSGGTARLPDRPPARLRDVASEPLQRWRTGLPEFDFVLGGGIVPGSMVLVGGEPGIGKSTLLLQVAARLDAAGQRTLYVSGEESPLQVKLRADRLDDSAADVELLSETLLETVIATGSAQEPAAMIVDSIQTVFTSEL